MSSANPRGNGLVTKKWAPARLKQRTATSRTGMAMACIPALKTENIPVRDHRVIFLFARFQSQDESSLGRCRDFLIFVIGIGGSACVERKKYEDVRRRPAATFAPQSQGICHLIKTNPMQVTKVYLLPNVRKAASFCLLPNFSPPLLLSSKF